MHRIAFTALLSLTGAAALVAGATAASAETTYTCTCDGYCGNGARGANPGTVVRGVAASRLPGEFGLAAAGTSRRTGWRCDAVGGAVNLARPTVTFTNPNDRDVQIYRASAPGRPGEQYGSVPARGQRTIKAPAGTDVQLVLQGQPLGTYAVSAQPRQRHTIAAPRPTIRPFKRRPLAPDSLARDGSFFYLRASDAPLYLHAHGGTSPGAQETLHPCPKGNNHPNCQWVLEPSPTTPGAFYVRSTGGPLYLHAHGGTNAGANLTLHACPKGNDHPNCQWFFEPSQSRPGAWYLRSKGGPLYAHTHGGTAAGGRNTLHACPKGNDHPNCQWQVELSAR